MKLCFAHFAWCLVAASLLVVDLSPCRAADNSPRTDSRYPFRTDFANDDLPWYLPKPGEFPPHHSDRRISGELVSVDFIHRSGQFRAAKNGELMDFTMPPYGAVIYLNAEADLRDIPLGTFFLFFLNQDAEGKFTRLATMQDQFSLDAGHSFSYRLDKLALDEGKLFTTRHSIPKKQPDLGQKEWLVSPQTRVWKDDRQVKLGDLDVGDELLFNITGKTATSPGVCTDIWVGTETHKLATETQRKKFYEFTKFRGLPAWIDRTEGNKITVTLFSGDQKNFKQSWMNDFGIGKELNVCVANDELRTWNPPVDKERGTLLEIGKAPVDCYGSSGVRLVFNVSNMLEGFRKGRIVRIFGSGWRLKDQFYGESLMGYGYGRLQSAELIELTPKEYPPQFPFHTDYGNAHLPWYQLKSAELPPRYSEHLVFGELAEVHAEKRGGKFRADRTGELTDFTLIPLASVRYLNADARLADLPLGTRCRFHLYLDPQGKFSLASLVSDEFSYLASNATTYRIESLDQIAGKLRVARQIPEVKNYNGDLEQPPDIGRSELLVTPEARVWKGSQTVKLSDLAVGDALLVNLTGELPGRPSHCTEIWVGPETHKLASDEQAKRHKAAK